jgi:hypothetical protein
MALRNGVQQRLLDYSATYVAQVTRRSACGILHRLEQRLAVWLLLLADRLPDSALEITHEQIAERLGVRRAGITVLAANMKTAGVISYSRGSLRIVDRPKLEALACECYRVLALVPPENPVGLETFPPALGVVSSSPAATLVAHKISLRG